MKHIAWLLDLAADLEHSFPVDYILQNFPIFNEKLAAEILMVANDIFNDVKETTHLRELCGNGLE